MNENVPILKPIIPSINLRMEELAREDKQKTYLTTEQFIKVFKSLSDEKSRELSKADSAAVSAARYAAYFAARYAAKYAAYFAAVSAAWDEADSAAVSAARYAARYAARDANLAILAKDAITPEHFNILTQPWTSCDLSPFVEDWEAVLNPKVEDAKSSVITYVFKDENETEYLVTLFPKADPRFAIRGYQDNTWGAPVPLIRKEVS